MVSQCHLVHAATPQNKDKKKKSAATQKPTSTVVTTVLPSDRDPSRLNYRPGHAGHITLITHKISIIHIVQRLLSMSALEPTACSIIVGLPDSIADDVTVAAG